ncbi:hypothetical protein B0T25DRAFT_554551 [Lasiosphaeria hispida]|uniref:Protein SSH4 n=1 Tax=Lasiosphaeria hispida TaxID=260671 RepID=A0AAJ0H875_9PEZI|nr:hypothetical protein B0T25DRAFT_554551 [Lasiosphaeria hispida]
MGMAVLWVAVILMIAPCVVADEGDAEFAFNLFSDLAPILALFGEKFATQFASESLDWLDHLIFAMVPLGIVTAMTAAIRVQGPGVAQAFIGRARENVASAEIELMSSTSNEVCELFNGKGIVRAMGKASIKQILVFPSVYEAEKVKLQHEDTPAPFLTSLKRTWTPSCGIHTIATACGYHPIAALGAPITRNERLEPGTVVMGGREYRGYFHGDLPWAFAAMSSWIHRTFRRRPVGDVIDGKTKRDDEESACSVDLSPPGSAPDMVGDKSAGATDDRACHSAGERKERDEEGETKEMEALRRLGPPNLQLNHSRPHSSEDERQQKSLVLCIAAISLVLQFGLVAIAGLTTYHGATRTAVGYEIKSYGFPCYAAGSFTLCLGMAVCSYIIGRSTVEWSWEPVKSPDAAEPHLFWVQKAQSVNDQTFSPYTIPEGKRLRIITSSRRNSERLAGGQKSVGRSPVADETGAATLSELLARTIGLVANPWGAATMFGVLATAAGFILQFIGLRALPYPVSFAQLGSILVMALFRAIIRNRTRRPLGGFETLPRYELDFLAGRIAFQEEFFGTELVPADGGKKRHNWRILTAGDKDGGKFPFRVINKAAAPSSADTQPDTQSTKIVDGHSEPKVSSQQLLRVRQRLGYVTTWQSAASSASLALSRSIFHVLSEFIKDPRNLQIPEQDGLSRFKRDDTICMNIALPATRTEQPYPAGLAADEDSVNIRCFWHAIDNGDGITSGTWEVDQDSLDAVLSLWMAYIEETHPPGLQSSAVDADGKGLRQAGWFDPGAITPTYRYRRILGDDLYNSGVLKRDLSWWVDGFSEQLLAPHRDPNVKLIIGFNGPEVLVSKTKGADAELAIDSCLSLPLILAQHLFTAFMWSIAKYLPPSCLGQGLPLQKQEVEVSRGRKFVPQQFRGTWSEPALRQRSLTKVAQHIERTGLGDATEVLLCIIPALSFADLLPNEVMLRILPQKNPDWGWAEVADCYDHLLQSSLGKSIEERLCYEAVVVTVDFLLVVTEPYGDDTEPWHELGGALNRLANTLISGYPHILGKLFMIYHLQRRFGDVIMALNRFGNIKSSRHQFEPNIGNAILSGLSEEDKDPLNDLRWTDIWSVDSRDFFAHKLSLSPGHLDILRILAGGHHDSPRDSDFRASRRLLEAYKTISSCINEYDIFGWTPLHYTSLCQEFPIVQKIYGAVQDLDPNGGKRGILKLRDKWGRNPLHVAARDGRHDNLKELLSFAEDSRAIAQLAGQDGLTAVHLAVKRGSEQCFSTLRGKLRGTPVTQTDIWDREALHIAASLAHTSLCEALLDCRGQAEPEREDEMGRTPLTHTLKSLNRERMDHGEDSETGKKLQQVVAKILKRLRQIVKFKYENGGTLLHLVAKYGDLRIFFDKVKEAADLDISGKDDDGRAPLHVAIRAQQPNNALFILTKLKGKDGLNLTKTKTREGVSAVAMACEMGLGSVVEELLKHRASLIEDEDGRRRSLLHFTVATGQANLAEQGKGKPYANLVDLLLKKATIQDLRAGDIDGQTPLIAACISGFEYAVTEILDRALHLASQNPEGAINLQDGENSHSAPKEFRDMVNQRDAEYNQSALEYACERGKEEVAKILLQPKYKVILEGAAEKWHRYTALHFAVGFAQGSAGSWLGIARLLCDTVPAFLEQKDEYGRTPLELAEDRGQEELRKLILSHKNTNYQQKEPFLKRTLDTPSEDRILWIPDLIGSLNENDFLKIHKERDRIAQLADRASIAAWTDMALNMKGDSRPELEIPCHFAIRGYTSDKVSGMIQKFKGHWENQKKGSAAEKLTRPDKLEALLRRREDGPSHDKPVRFPGESGWSIVDWAKSFGIGDDKIADIREGCNDILANLEGTDLNGRKAEIASGETKYMFDLPETYQDLGLLSQEPYEITKISIVKDISTSLKNNSGILSLRTALPLPPDGKAFSFEVKIIKWPPSGTLMIGFCGEFFPKEEDLDCPGKFYNSWGFEDRGRLYVEDKWDLIPPQRSVSSSFEPGDTITVFLGPPNPDSARNTWYSKKSKDSKKGVEFISDGKDAARLLSKDRFQKGKIYPCIGVDVTSGGVGLEIEVDFGNSKVTIA